ncbi:kelch-like protein 36 [Ciona intestinalis]
MQKSSDGCNKWRDCDSISHKHCVKNWRNLVRLWRAQKLCDVVITVKGEPFRCHAIVPASVSPFFRNAFLKKTAMSVPNGLSCEKEVIVDFMTKEIFSQVLTFMYTADVLVTPATARPLILAAARLEMQGMVNAVLRRILDLEMAEIEDNKANQPSNMDFRLKSMIHGRQRYPFNQKVHDAMADNKNQCPETDCCGELNDDDSQFPEAPGPQHGYKYPKDENLTVTGVMDELRLQGDLATLSFVQTFAARNYSEVCETEAFLGASVHTIACLLDDDRLNVDEFRVFMSLCRWLEAEPMHLVHAPYLLSKTRLQLLSPQELAENVETKDYLMRKKKCRVLILEAFRFHCLQAQGETVPEGAYSLEPPRGQKQRIGTDKYYDSDDEEWSVAEDGGLVKKDKTSPFCPIKPCACCPDYILASGGIDTKQKTASDGVYRYEERDNSWLRFARMQEPRNHHAAVYCKGALYIIGGSDPSLTGPGAEVCPISSCHRLGLGSLKWCKIESLSTPRMSLQAAYVNGFIYAIGGQDHKQRILRDVERYSITRGSWEYSGSLSSARAGLCVCVYKGRMWAIGGYCHKSGVVLDTVEAYDEEYGNWEMMPAMRFPRCFANAAVCQGHLYVLGGAWLDAETECGNFSSVYDVDIYNSASKCWEGVTALRVGRHDAGLAVLGPRIYIVGGKHCDDGAIKNLDSVECFDVEKDDWVDGVSPLPLPLLGPAITFTK